MSDANQQIAGIEVPDAEVELSAQDLLDLSAPCPGNGSIKAPRASSTPVAPRNKSVPRLYLSLALAIGVVGVLYLAVAPSGKLQQPPQAQLPAKGEGEPVLFANPFDANEVFEFPAGTSEAQARDRVAEVLMARAMERQRQFDARVTSNR